MCTSHVVKHTKIPVPDNSQSFSSLLPLGEQLTGHLQRALTYSQTEAKYMITFKPFDFRESVWPNPHFARQKNQSIESSSPSPKRLLILSHSAHRWWGTGRVRALWVLKLQTVERGKAFRGFGNTSPTQQIGNEFLCSDDFTEETCT